MTVIRELHGLLGAWLGATAIAIVSLFDRLISPAVVHLVEREDGGFDVEAAGPTEAITVRSLSAGETDLAAMLAGRRAEIVLRPQRFVFRRLELPLRAADFLDGIVRAQIDRLTPWSQADAVFGCSRAAPSGSGIATIVAATMRSAVEPLLTAVGECRPASVALFAEASAESAQRIRVLDRRARGRLNPSRLGRGLGLVLASSAMAASLLSIADAVVTDQLAAKQDELGRRIAQRRALLGASGEGGASQPLAGLERRKQETPASALVLDALTRALPDHTYLTEMHLAGTRLQIAGLTRDAPSLIPLLERSSHFARATFYAPTTRASSDAGERFHIEARVEPKNAETP